MARKLNYARLFTLRKDGRYQASYTDNKGRHFLYDRDPERLYKKLCDRKGGNPDIVTLADMADKWERRHREEIEDRTWANYEPHVREIVSEHGKRSIESIETADVATDLIRAKARGYSATVVNARRSIWRMILDQAVLDGHVKYNPATLVKLPKGLKRGKRTAPTKEQMKVVLSNVGATFGLFPFLLLCTGLRKSEALALSWTDVDLDSRLIHVNKSIDYTNGANPKYKAPKTDAGNRDVPIIDILYSALKTEKRDAVNDLLFPCPPSNRGGAGGGLMTDKAYEDSWLKYCSTVGLLENGKPMITAHNLRHGTATIMFEQGVDELTTTVSV